MQSTSFPRYFFLLLIAVFYFLPVLLYTAFSADLNEASGWQIWISGLFLASLGSLVFFLILKACERTLRDAKQDALNSEENIEKMEESSDRESAQNQIESAGALARMQESTRQEYESKLIELKGLLEKKQQQIETLESSVTDLTYEVKTLLQLNEMHQAHTPAKKNLNTPSTATATPPPYPPEAPPLASQNIQNTAKPASMASQQLQRCVWLAQQMTGSALFGASSRFRDFSIESHALDLRRLFDSLQNENGGIVLFYAQKEGKLLFASEQTKELLGWPQEKFLQNFPLICEESYDAWKQGLRLSQSQKEAIVRLTLKSKNGQSIPLNCHLSCIPEGLFKGQVIGLLVE